MAPNLSTGSSTTKKTHPRTKVTTEQVKNLLSGSKKTIQEVAANFKVTPATARKHILALVDQNKVKKAGTKAQPEGKRGRPADLYATA